MANSTTEAAAGKRDRLIASARELFHQRGVASPSIAEIAERAEVPPGNVYYYFKTRDDLIEAVIESRAKDVAELLGSLDRKQSPAARLKALARSWYDVRDLVAAHGCPLGSLSVGLSAEGRGLDREAAELFATLIRWAEDQFRELGCRDPREHALALFSGVQGAALLANAFDDPAILSGQIRRLERWIDSLS